MTKAKQVLARKYIKRITEVLDEFEKEFEGENIGFAFFSYYEKDKDKAGGFSHCHMKPIQMSEFLRSAPDAKNFLLKSLAVTLVGEKT